MAVTENMSGVEGTGDILLLILFMEKVFVMPCLKPSIEWPKEQVWTIEDTHPHLFLSFLLIQPALC